MSETGFLGLIDSLNRTVPKLIRITLQKGATTISFDIDPAAFEKNYLELIENREDIFSDYTQKDFEAVFLQDFTIQKVNDIQGSQRCIYLTERK